MAIPYHTAKFSLQWQFWAHLQNLTLANISGYLSERLSKLKFGTSCTREVVISKSHVLQLEGVNKSNPALFKYNFSEVLVCSYFIMLSLINRAVYGWLQDSFVGVERGASYSVQMGYLKGAAQAGVNLVFSVAREPGTAGMLSQSMLFCTLYIT